MQLAHYPPHLHVLRYGQSRPATVYLASRTYGLCLTIRTGPREARSQQLHVTESSATEFIEILYASTTPMHSSHCSTPHSYTTTGRTGTPSYQRPLVYPYRIFDLCRPHRVRQHQGNPDCRDFPVTRSRADLDLPGSGRGHRDMSDPEDTSQSARGGSRSRGGRAPAREDDDGARRHLRRGDFVPADDP